MSGISLKNIGVILSSIIYKNTLESTNKNTHHILLTYNNKYFIFYN
jgi:hypothetical protein